MATATFNGKVIAQSDDTTFVEGNHYFPIDSLDKSVAAVCDVVAFSFKTHAATDITSTHSASHFIEWHIWSARGRSVLVIVELVHVFEDIVQVQVIR